jgi:hypothetical protein
MVTNPKGYRPKTKRRKYPLTVNEQKKLIDNADKPTKALLVFMLSTGAHPIILTDKTYFLDLQHERNYSWNRPKTDKPVQGVWSKAMLEGSLFKELRRFARKKKGTPWYLVSKLGAELGFKGLCPLQLRHTHFVNRARLGHNAFDIAHGAGTDLATIYTYYTVGMGESRSLTEDEREWLKWLMEA